MSGAGQCCRWEEISLRSPGKFFYFYYQKNVFTGSKYPKNQLLNFEKNFTGAEISCCVVGNVHLFQWLPWPWHSARSVCRHFKPITSDVVIAAMWWWWWCTVVQQFRIHMDIGNSKNYLGMYWLGNPENWSFLPDQLHDVRIKVGFWQKKCCSSPDLLPVYRQHVQCCELDIHCMHTWLPYDSLSMHMLSNVWSCVESPYNIHCFIRREVYEQCLCFQKI